MKKLPLKVMSVALVCAIAFSTAACGKKKNNSGDEGGVGMQETSRRGQKITDDSPWYESTSATFSPEYDNLLSSTYSYNKGNYSNAALIGGEGEGLNKRTTSIGTATGLNRYESYIDGSSVSSNGEIITVEQYIGLLQQYGQEQLSNQYFIENFEGEIIPNGVYKINQDYFLGDLVQVVNEKGISAVPRIIEIIYSEDSTGTAVIPTFSKWEVS